MSRKSFLFSDMLKWKAVISRLFFFFEMTMINALLQNASFMVSVGGFLQ